VFSYIYDHWPRFLAGLVGFFILLGIGWGLFYYKSKIDNKISEDMAQAVDLYHKDNLTEGANRYREIIESYGKNKKALEARLYLAHTYFEQRNFEEAARWYKEVLDYVPENSSLLKGIALLDLGYTYEEWGKLNQAIKNYNLLSQMESTFFQMQSYLALGRCYEQQGDKKNAINYYKKYMERQEDKILQERISRWENR
jgi:predicted negative regulator of RcsB-dependent stress response